ncbi:MAG: SUMF1/EgtB/PvdO family nonheme iron enzyme [Verrucomicrobiota bacterium]
MVKTVVVVQPAGDVLDALMESLKRIGPEIRFVKVEDGSAAAAAIAKIGTIDLLISEVYFENADGLQLLYNFRTERPETPVLVATRYDLSDYKDYLVGLPQITAPFNEAELGHHLRPVLGILEGQQWGNMLIGHKVGADRDGARYAATDVSVKRQVYLTILKQDASPQEVQNFKASAAYMAKAGHSNVTAVYAAGEFGERSYLVREFWAAHNLQDLADAGEKIEPRLGARIIATVCNVLLHWEKNGFAHPVLEPKDVTVTPNGVVKVDNCVDPSLNGQSAPQSPLAPLSNALKAVLPPLDELSVRMRNLLNNMRQSDANIGAAMAEAQAIDTELAPEREVAVSKQHREAVEVIEREKKKEQLFHYLSIGAFVVVVLLLAWLFFSQFFDQGRTMTDFRKMLRVPAGEFVYQDGKATTGEFWIDQYEVTIGQYLQFLQAVEQNGPEAYAHPDQQGTNINFEPKQFAAIYNSIKQGKKFNGQELTFDSPIFNIDWYDAWAYAKFRDKRLPTEEEWEKAARGLDGNLYPWGNNFDETYANTGRDYVGKRDDDRGAIDGYYGVNPVNAISADRSPFGVIGMGGNVSEWTSSIVPNSKISTLKSAVVRGGNFLNTQEKDFQTTRRDTSKLPEDSEFYIGLRLVRDSPPTD